MLKGNIFYTTDENLAMNSSFNKGYLVVALVDDSDTRFSQAQIRGIQYLLPPYMAFEAENLGDMDQFNKIYYNHLTKPESESYIAILLNALYRGYTVLIFIDEDEMQLSFPKALFDFFRYKYGLIIGNENEDCVFDIQYEDVVRLTLYKFHHIPAQDVIDNIKYPITDPYICKELCDELGIQSNGNPVKTIDEYIKQDRYQNRVETFVKDTNCNWYIKGEVK